MQGRNARILRTVAAATRLALLLGTVLALALLSWILIPVAAADPTEPSNEKPSIAVDVECLGPDIPPRAEVRPMSGARDSTGSSSDGRWSEMARVSMAEFRMVGRRGRRSAQISTS